MKRVAIFFTLTLLMSFSAAAQDWSESELQEMYMSYLNDLSGYENIRIDSDGDIQFKKNDRNYFIEVNEGDNEFFRVVMFNIWPIESTSEHVQALDAVNEVNKELKVVKAYVTNDDNIWIASELFVGRPDNFKPIFERMIKVMDDAVDTFVETM